MKPQELKSLHVEEFLEPPYLVDPLQPISKVIGNIKERDAFEAFVEEKERTAVVSLRDLLNVKSITSTKVSKVMHYIPRLILSSTVGEASRIMFDYRTKSLPVCSGSKVKGQVSSPAILDRLMDSNHYDKLSSVMTPSPVTLTIEDEATKARRIMIKEKIDQIPILKSGKLVGVITSSKIAFNQLPSADRMVIGDWRTPRYDLPVMDYAEEVPVSNEIKDSLNDVYKNMKKNNSQYSVITNFDEVQGIITRRDFMRLLVEQRDTSDHIPMYMVGLPDDPFESEAAREKFARVVTLLRKEHPKMEEARAVIKSSKTNAARTRHEVQIFVKTPTKQFSYHGNGYELPDVFDGISSWSKKHVAREQKKPRQRTRGDPGVLQSMI